VDLVCGTREFPRIARADRGGAPRGPRCWLAARMPPVSEAARDLGSGRTAARRSSASCAAATTTARIAWCRTCAGRKVSRPVEEVVDEAKRLADDGCREIHAARPERQQLRQVVFPFGASARGPARAAGPDSPAWRECVSSPRIRRTLSREISRPLRDLPTVCEHLHHARAVGSDRVLRPMTAVLPRAVIATWSPSRASSCRTSPSPAIHRRLPRRDRGGIRPRPPRSSATSDSRPPSSSSIHGPAPPLRNSPTTCPGEKSVAATWRWLEIQAMVQPRGKPQVQSGRMVEVLVERPRRRDASRLTGRLRPTISSSSKARDARRRTRRVRVESATALTLAGRRTVDWVDGRWTRGDRPSAPRAEQTAPVKLDKRFRTRSS